MSSGFGEGYVVSLSYRYEVFRPMIFEFVDIHPTPHNIDVGDLRLADQIGGQVLSDT